MQAIRRQLRVALDVVAIAVQCAAVAAILWTVLAAPGFLIDSSSTGARVTAAMHH